MGTPTSQRWQLAFLLLAAIWGASFLLIKVGDEALAPLQVSFGRMLCGAAVLVVVLIVRRERLPRDRRVWGHAAVAALLLNAAPFSLIAIGETRVSSILAGLWNATTPLLVLVAALAALPDEHPTRRKALAVSIGFMGVVVLLGPWNGLGGSALLGSLACLGSACCYGLGFPYARRYLAGRGESTVSLVTAQLLCGAAELALVAPWTAGAPAALPARVVGSVVVLGALGTGIAYLLNYRVIRLAGATIASTVTYVVPVFSTVLGAAILGESFGWNEPVGAAMILLGVASSHRRR